MSVFLAWQIVDSAFPTGAFAHSLGLEAAWQHGEIEDVTALGRFVDETIRQAGWAALPFVSAAYREPHRLAWLDELNEAFLLNAVANRASRIQGRTLAATAARIWPSEETVANAQQSSGLRAHVAPLTGVTFRAIGLPLDTAQQIVLYGAARTVLSAAVRLGIVGSYEAQRLQRDCGRSLEVTMRQCAALDIEDLAQTAPLVDLLQSAHDRLYSRLFQS
jgi:urease accessory protein